MNDYSVDLAGEAEQDANAMNIVNSAGGMVSNESMLLTPQT